MASLRDKTISGIFWSFLQKVGAQGISFVVMILLARLLSPKAFGLIGMLMIFVQISQALVRGGFRLALIQKKDANEEDFSSIFYVNLMVSVILYLIIYFSAPWIAKFYNQPLLDSLVKVLMLVVIINAFSMVQETKLIKDFRFKTLAIVHIPSTIIGGGIGIIMAYNGFGVWSIVAFQVINRFVFAIQIWIYAKWKPLLAINWVRTKKLFSFGSKLMISGILTKIYNNIFFVVIGKFYPVSSVGYYQNASTLTNRPSGLLTSVIRQAVFPALALIQDDDKRLKRGFRQGMQQTIFWICPIFVFAGIMAPPLFDFVLGAKWMPAVPYFRWLCVVAIFTPLLNYNLDMVNVKGRSDMWLKLQMTRRIGTIIALFVVYSYGIEALLIVQATSVVSSFCLFAYFSGKDIKYKMVEQLKDILPIMLLNVIVGGGVYVMSLLIGSFNNIIQIIIGFGLGLIIYVLVAQFCNIIPWRDFKQIVIERVLPKLNLK